MPSPFPGMDPYLENPELWPDVHHEFISEIRAALNPSLRPRYVARVELRVYISDDDDPGREALIPDVRVEKTGRRKGSNGAKSASGLVITEALAVPTLPDDEIKEAFLKITHLESDALVTIIEILSPSNKVRGSRGRASFMGNRRDTIESEVHWVELDLLRGGERPVRSPLLARSDYRALVSRTGEPRRAYYWPISVRQALPVIGIPLRGEDPDLPLDLGAVFKAVYERAAYDLSLDYRKEPRPPLQGADAAWAKRLLKERAGK